MKKISLLLGQVLMTGLAIVGCQKTNKPVSGNNNDNNDDTDTGDEVEIVIDGDFSDWDAFTATSEDGTVYVDKDIAKEYDALKILKVTSDDGYVYVYTEIASDKIYTDSGIGRGDSYEGTGGKNPAPGPLWIYLDVDNKPETGFLPHGVKELDDFMFTEIGCEHALQLYLIRPTETGIVDMSWCQTNQFVSGAENGSSIDDAYDWPKDDPNGKDGYGWNHENDNRHVTYDNFAAGAAGAVTPIEFAISRDTITADYPDAGGSFRIGVAYQGGNAEGAWVWTGRIPSSGKPFVLTLK